MCIRDRGYTAEIFAVLVSILGGAFLIRAFDIDKSWSNWTKATPTGFIRIFALVTGIILILASVPAGIANIDSQLFENGLDFSQSLSNQVVVGQFLQGLFPFLWMGLGTISAGILISNWLNRKLKHISDVLRIIVLAAIYPTVAQFTNILTTNDSSFTLIPPLLAGAAITLISATLLFRRYRKRGGKLLTE